MNLDKNIGWCTHTHNITTGCWNKKLGICNVKACYAQQTAENPFYRKAFPYGFEPHFYPERIAQVAKLKIPGIIFMDSMSDTFGSWWTEAQVVLPINCAINNPHHKYVFLTKNPERMVEILQAFKEKGLLDLMQHIYFGTSVSGEDSAIERNRLVSLWRVSEMGYKTVISFEPLLHDPKALIFNVGGIGWVNWALLGGQTKPTRFPPYMSKCRIRDECDPRDIPLFIKDNAVSETCKREKADRRMFPADLLPIAVAWGKV